MKTVPALGTSVSRAARVAQTLSLFIPATAPAALEKNVRPISLQLARGQVHRLDPADGVREIQVLDGVVWLTTTPAEGDILLRTSDRFAPTAGSGRIVFEALKDASVLLVRGVEGRR